MTTVDCWFDYGSPFAYFLATRLDDAVAPFAARVAWKPVALQQLGTYAPYGDVKRRYVVVDALRTAELHGIPLRAPEPMPVQSGLALRAALVAEEQGIFPAFHDAVFRAAWAEARDIGQPEVLASCAGLAGDAAARFVARARSAEIDARLAALAAEAAARGVFGVPTMALGDELFWGNDRLDALLWRLRQRKAGA
jgi:2-hydroxychromene-2-carboxylate isomerase